MDGQTVSSAIEADSEQDVVHQLRSKNLIVLRLAEVQEKKKISSVLFSRRINSDDIVLFTRQLTTMVGAGLPLIQGLTTLKEQVTNPALAKVIDDVVGSVEAGSSFSEAISKHPKVFNNLFLNMVRAGEASGQLTQILERVANYLEEMASLKRKIRSAMMYPVIVSLMALGITLILLIKVIPVFKGIYDDFGGDLPIATKILISVSESLNQWFGLFLILVAGMVLGLRYFYKSEFGHYWIDRIKLFLPVYGVLSRKISISRFSKTFSTLIQSGVPILSALAIVANTSGNKVIERAVVRAAEKIREGEPIADPLKESNVFPPMVLKMIAVGEKTGQLDLMLAKISEFYDEQVKATVDGLTSIIEPILIGFLGLVVGGIVISMFLPIFKLSTIISG